MINMFPSLKKGIGKTASLTSPRPRWGERIIEKLILFNGILAIAVLLGVFFILLRQGIPALIETPFYSFLFGTHWYPVSDPPTFGTLSFFVATMWVTVISTVLAVPIGVGAAIFLAEVAPRKVADAVKPVVELLSGFPSVVMGFIGLVLLSPWVQNTLGLSSGLCGVTAGIMLAMMSLPIIVSVSEDALRAVPDEFRQAAYGLGSTRWEVIWHVCVPSALSGISAAIMLGIGRDRRNHDCAYGSRRSAGIAGAAHRSYDAHDCRNRLRDWQCGTGRPSIPRIVCHRPHPVYPDTFC